ncbi:MAG TPA: low affinity iron permease family protein [Thermoanaerobaculia bacterium]|nr:low affinity iron permease family protein [Thermoanaerobaculia bacterium]
MAKQKKTDRNNRRESHPPAKDLFFASVAEGVTRWAGSTWGFFTALGVVVAWALTGPIFGYSDTWQLVINTGTTIVTFLMVFLIQRSQNRDSLAVQIKLNEIVAAIDGASNRLIDVETLTEPELRVIRSHFRRLAEMAEAESSPTSSHSIEEAERRHERKRKGK